MSSRRLLWMGWVQTPMPPLLTGTLERNALSPFIKKCRITHLYKTLCIAVTVTFINGKSIACLSLVLVRMCIMLC